MSYLSSEKIIEILTTLKTSSSALSEGENLDFKEYCTSKMIIEKARDIAKALCAFFNKSGGCLLLGIKDGDRVKNKEWMQQFVGVNDVDILQIEPVLKSNLLPAIDLQIEIHLFENKKYIRACPHFNLSQTRVQAIKTMAL